MTFVTAIRIRFGAIGVCLCFLMSAPLSAWCIQAESNANNQQAPVDSGEPTLEWLVGHDETLAFVLRGELVGGETDAPFSVTATFRTWQHELKHVAAEMDGRQFRLHVPADGKWHSMTLNASDSTGTWLAARFVLTTEVAQLARERMTLELKPASREITVRTFQGNTPVSGARVRAWFADGLVLSGQSNDDGIATIHCPVESKLSSLMSWKDKDVIGGYSFHQNAARNPDANEHQIEMLGTQPRIFRLIDETGQPVPDVEFRINVTALRPVTNYLLTAELFTETTGADGETIVRWMPDLLDARVRVDVVGDEWTAEARLSQLEGDVYTQHVRRSRKHQRQTIRGTVTSTATDSLAGMVIALRSFEGEADGRSDIIRAFTNPDGSFSADVLPGATYCYFLDDPRWVSEHQHGILYDPDTGKSLSPEIEIVPGIEVELVATRGVTRIPYPNLSITANAQYHFSWIKDGHTQHGTTGKSQEVYTDKSGRATVRCLPGEYQLYARATDWSQSKSFTVEEGAKEGATSPVEIHRPIGETMTVTGTLVASAAGETLKDCKIIIAGFDGDTQGRQVVTSDDQGNFAFDTNSSIVAMHAHTADGLASRFQVVEMPVLQVTLELQPTMVYLGRVLDSDDQPVEGQIVTAKVEETRNGNDGPYSVLRFDGSTIEAITDADGYYQLKGVPTGVRLVFSTMPADGPGSAQRMGERFIASGENRPLDVFRLGPARATAERSLHEKFQSLQKTCALYDIHVLAIVGSGADASELASDLVSDYEGNPAIGGYLPLFIDASPERVRADVTAFLVEQDWTTPEPGQLYFAAIDASSGAKVNQLRIDISDPEARKLCYEFVAANEPAAQNAEAALDEAFAEAKRSGRAVWVQHSQTRCGPCFQLSRWIDEHRDVLEKDIVFCKIDDVRDSGGREVIEKMLDGRHVGIPFVVLYSPDGDVLADSIGPLGNIGFPSSFEGVNHLRAMIDTVRSRITDSELDSALQPLVDK